jgi:hypothetical protein
VGSPWWWITNAIDGLFGRRAKLWALRLVRTALVVGVVWQVPAQCVFKSFVRWETSKALATVQPLFQHLLQLTRTGTHIRGR